ncbi:MAG TPA: class II glutamine amidotransferase, partial [Labilithrix sp.]
MCRLVGIIASEQTEFGLCLTEAPRCLARLSREHPDGWGVAIHDTNRWSITKGTLRADEDNEFKALATRSRGNVLVAHVRQKTIGPTRIENTHPFERDGWVFAHNGTIRSIDALRAGCSKTRLAEVVGDTDSELLFAYVLTRLDDAGLVRLEGEPARAAASTLLARVSKELRGAIEGAFNFLLTDGTTCFAHRFGRSLFVLERGPRDKVVPSREVAPGASILAKWTSRRRAVLVASERMTDEPWVEIPDATLLRVDRLPEPTIIEAEAPTRAA